MPSSKQAILHDALELPPIERAELIEDLLSSFEFSYNEEIDKAWAVEVENRVEAYEKGLISARPIHDVFEDINKMK